MDLQEQYQRIKKMNQTSEVIFIKEKIEIFINKTHHVEMLADQLTKQVKELERMGEELDKEEREINKMISESIK